MKPILFNTEMVRATLDGRKTATRRVVKPTPRKGAQLVVEGDKRCAMDIALELKDSGPNDRRIYIPRYYIGDILYVRETWKVQSAHRYDADAKIMFKAGGPMSTIQFPGGVSQTASRDEYDEFVGKWMKREGWIPSIHMPKEAARIFLRVTDVRVERLRDIDEEGAKAEGVYAGWRLTGRGSCALSARQAFMWLWEYTTHNAAASDSWALNPWVWVIEFERISREEAQG